MAECIFCKIIEGKLPSYKIHEDDEFLAILDRFPNTKGMTVVLTKKHYGSYVFDMPEDVYSRFLKFTRQTIKILDKGLKVRRTAMVMEGMGIDHAHIKLYPMHGLREMFIKKEDCPILFPEKYKKEPAYFEKYPGYIATLFGSKASDEDLNKVQKEIIK